MSLKIFVAPLRYVQGPDALSQLGEQLDIIGVGRPLLLVSKSARKVTGEVATESLRRNDLPHAFTDFGGECTWDEIERVRETCIKGGHDAIISCGGGKTIDTGRAAAAASAVMVNKFPPEFIPRIGASVACINIPTVAATDASTSASSLVYNQQGVMEAALAFPTNPAMVLVDTGVIARAPARLLVAGMGDALATFFEADVCRRTGTPSFHTGAQSTMTAQTVARLCLQILLEHGLQATKEAEAGVPGPGIEAVTEANVLLSGLGFENGGLSAAHALEGAFHLIPNRFETHLYHGELVAFGTLTQLVLEARDPEFLERIFRFCKSVGLPTTFSEMTLTNVTDEDLKTIADGASKSIIIRSMPEGRSQADENGRFYDHLSIFRALKATDALGRSIIHPREEPEV
jgi:glycerol dehydrogenase